jgi:hypothetical protein
VSVRPDENAPAICPDEAPLELGHEVAQLIIRQLRDVAAKQSKSLSRLSKTSSINRVLFAIAAVDFARVGRSGDGRQPPREPIDLRPVGDIDDVRGDAQPLRQSRPRA